MTATFADYFGEPLKVPKPQEPPSTTPNKQKPRGRMAFDRATTDIKLWLFKNEPRSWAELKELRTALYYRKSHGSFVIEHKGETLAGEKRFLVRGRDSSLLIVSNKARHYLLRTLCRLVKSERW